MLNFIEKMFNSATNAQYLLNWSNQNSNAFIDKKTLLLNFLSIHFFLCQALNVIKHSLFEKSWEFKHQVDIELKKCY